MTVKKLGLSTVDEALEKRREAEWQRALQRRREPDGNRRPSQLREALDALEDEYGITTGVALKRIEAGTLHHDGWAKLAAEYHELVREPWRRMDSNGGSDS